MTEPKTVTLSESKRNRKFSNKHVHKLLKHISELE